MGQKKQNYTFDISLKFESELWCEEIDLTSGRTYSARVGDVRRGPVEDGVSTEERKTHRRNLLGPLDEYRES